jgi:tetratricopeptide (TPR) repeat protein
MKTRFWSLVLLFVLPVPPCVAQAGDRQAEDWLAEGKKLIAERRFADAVVAFKHLKQAAPEDPRAYFFSGIALAEAGQLSAAAAELNEAVRLDPAQPEYALSQANVLVRLGQKALAVKALAVFENEGYASRLSAAGLWLLADIHYRLGKNQESLRALQLLASRTPEDSRIDFHRGQIYKIMGNLDLAQEAFAKSIKNSADNPAAYFELGRILEQRNDMNAAKEALLEAVKQDGANPEYLHGLGAVCLALGEVDEAIGYLERAEPSGAAFPKIYYALGQAYQRKGDRNKAAKYLAKVQETNLAQRKKEVRDHGELTLITLGEKQLEQGNTAEARALFEEVLQANPDNWHAHEYLARMFLSSGDRPRAHQHLLKMEQIDSHSVEGNYLMALYCYQNEEFARAAAYAERARSVQPGYADVRNLLGNIYLKLAQPEKALEEYRAAVRLAPARSDFRANLENAEKPKEPPATKPQK